MTSGTSHDKHASASQPMHDSAPRRTPWKLYREDVSRITQANYSGSGTDKDPYVVDWLDGDKGNPQTWSTGYKWALTILASLSTLAVGFCSSAYAGAAGDVMLKFDVTPEVATLGVSMFVLGFALGPLLWAPLSELFGRRPLLIYTYFGLTAFNIGCAVAPNMPALIVLRFFAGAFGSSPLTNAGAIIADMFDAKTRGLALCLFASAPFMGPVIGPIVGGFTGQSVGWRWVMWVMVFFTVVILIICTLFTPETYAPVLLRKRAEALAAQTGKVYRSKYDSKAVSLTQMLKTGLTRPWILLIFEPIVLILSIYMAIIYGVLYMFFAAFPIVFHYARGWSPGISGLAFIGIAVGIILALVYILLDNARYVRAAHAAGGHAPAEARLPPAIVGGVAIVLGLFWFAFTNSPSKHWLICIAATVPFGFGMINVFLPCFNYLVDSYLIYAASVLAANSVLRSLFGTVFPLFTTKMYRNLGIHWASAVPAFLALACLPFPVLFWKYGAVVRSRCKYSAEASRIMQQHMAVSVVAKSAGGEEAKGQANAASAEDKV
ncbi:hypothetical protein Agub_g8504 [Astrephomene gubernaculifera]|uniref:Major facilitator superfamily (MFS) profile domain-containing protein n=1 Tax=Astrephomene gubernaculifera TaxID=47775 RepID=A0AAD3HN78_9CHLO|nr:hypothetical protein Agub_g8504 [Astrephomene gubernaculifera]